MRLAWVSPLPPTPSGIGDYSADLLPEIAQRVPTTAFTTEPQWRPDSAVEELEVRPFEQLEGALAEDSELIAVYHQGNNVFHEFVYDLSMRFPGVLVLHDVVLHHLLLDRANRTREWEHFREPLKEQYQDLAPTLYDARRTKIATDLDKFLFPLSGPLMRRSLLTVVHSDYAREIARMEFPGGVFQVIPHHPGRPPDLLPYSPEQIRSDLGIDAASLFIGSFGYVTIPKQVDLLLEAFAEFLGQEGEGDLVVVGSDEQGGRMGARARELEIDHRVRFTGYLPRQEFYSYLNAVDVVVALRYPSAGETSGTLSRALSMGCCLLVGDCGSSAEIPSGACVQVPLHGEANGEPVHELARSLRRLADRPGLRRAIGESARRFAATELSLRRCARLYVEAAASASVLRQRFPPSRGYPSLSR